MLSRPQIVLLKRAQAQAGMDDGEYRDAIEAVSGLAGCRSGKDERLTDGHLDKLLGYFEAIYWRRVDAGELQVSINNGVFRGRGAWARRNSGSWTSRDRFTTEKLRGEIELLENGLALMGFGLKYVAAIQNNIRPFSLWAYKAALERTLESKRKKAGQPF